jgi:hypothetical protein
MSIKIRGAALAPLGALALLSSGCATIVHSGSRDVPVTSSPPGATVTIYDRDGKAVMKQNTPFVASLRPKYSYFKGQQYRAVFDMPGYQPAEVQINSAVSGWYWGNILFGGLVGMLIVDPNTGAMYNLMPNNIDQTLTPQTTQAAQ